jgi:ATP-dependent helicase/nuclease subunit A
VSGGAPLPDAAARRLARERFDAPILLEAGAGTGKTRALVERLLSWSLDAGWSESAELLGERAAIALQPPPAAPAIAAHLLDGIVAITFTDAAAAEMAGRVAAALGAIARGAPCEEAGELADRLDPATLAARAAALLDALGRARIQTIHAFCRALLAAHPFDAGLHPSFLVDAEGEALERIASETLAARASAALAAGDPDWLALLDEGCDLETILDALVRAVRAGIRRAELEEDPFPAAGVAARLDETAAALSPLVDVLDGILDALPLNAKAREVLPALAALARAVARDAQPQPLADASALAGDLLSELGGTLASWAEGKSIARILQRLPPEIDDFPSLAAEALRALDRLSGLDPAALARARRVFAPLVGEVRERMRREGFALFEELLDRARDLLAQRPDVRAAVRRGIRQLLVDEFQDTDRRQCALVELLALDGNPAERPGLFVVGDPKQSIYGWRSADLAAYEDFLAVARAQGALTARLEVNFRSTPEILAEVERVLAPHLRAEPGLQPAFERLLPSERGRQRAAARGDRPGVEYWLACAPGEGRKTGARAANRIEARAIALDLRAEKAADPGLAWSDVALLARTTGDLEDYLQALRQEGIPFAVERDRSYWRRREVIDAAALVRAVVDPGDHLALVTFLRSPWVGVPDAALLPLWRQSFPERVDALVAPDTESLDALHALLAQVAVGLPADLPGRERIAGWEASAFAALEVLAELRAAFGGEPAERFVERLRARLALEATAAARFLGRFGLANLERFFAELEGMLEESGHDPAAVTRFLRSAVAEAREREEARPPERAADAVQVMTIHRAKGLQFRQVYLVQVHKGRGGNSKPAFDFERFPDGLATSTLFGLRDLAWANALARRAIMAERELVRVLYVALTRAAERLVVAGQPWLPHQRTGSFVPLLSERIAESPAGEGGDEGGRLPRRDAHGVLWRLPASEPGWTAEPAVRTAAAPAPTEDPAALARDVELLDARRGEAAARAARPRFVTASALAAHANRSIATASAQPPGDEAEQAARRARERGTALHRALELAPLARRDEVAWRIAVEQAAARPLANVDRDASAELDRALAALRSSHLWQRLESLSEHVLARELPLVAASDPADPRAPLDGYVGTLDLLYRDPASGETVVADFKSDALAGEDAIAARVELYRPQLALYGRAVGEALGLAAPPRLELWLLAADRIVVVPPAAARDAGAGAIE